MSLPVHDYLRTIGWQLANARGLTELRSADFRFFQVLAFLFVCPFSDLPEGIHVVALRAIFFILRLTKSICVVYIDI